MNLSEPIDVILVSGFLGTGKTTLINAYLTQVDTSRIGVIVNEAGDTTIDGLLIAEATGNASSVRMLGNGCLCCQAADDLAQAIRRIVDGHIGLTGKPTATVLVEASGLARPGPLLRQIQAINDLPLRVHVVATVDAALLATPDLHPELLDQWAAASTLVMTREDTAADAGLAAITLARLINPLATIVSQASPAERAMAAFTPNATLASPRGRFACDTGALHGVQVLTLLQVNRASWDDYAEWFENLIGLTGDRLLRVKSLIHSSDGPSRLLQGVGTTFALPTPVTFDEPGHTVVIVRGLTAHDIETVEPLGLFSVSQNVTVN
jgi:G3E family GTPase